MWALSPVSIHQAAPAMSVVMRRDGITESLAALMACAYCGLTSVPAGIHQVKSSKTLMSSGAMAGMSLSSFGSTFSATADSNSSPGWAVIAHSSARVRSRCGLYDWLRVCNAT